MKNNKNTSSVIHQINNLLATISLSCEIMLREKPKTLNTEQQAYLKNIIKDGKKIQSLTKKLSNKA